MPAEKPNNEKAIFIIGVAVGLIIGVNATLLIIFPYLK